MKLTRNHFWSALIAIYISLILLYAFWKCQEFGDIYNESYNYGECPDNTECVQICSWSQKFSNEALEKNYKNIKSYNKYFYQSEYIKFIRFNFTEPKCKSYERKVIAEDLENVEKEGVS